MRTVTYDETAPAVSDALLTTGEAARVLGVSRQHIVDLCNRGDLPYETSGVHRRVRRSDIEALRVQSGKMTRDQRRSLWMGHAIAAHVVRNPDQALTKARINLDVMRASGPRGLTRQWLDEWEVLLDGPLEGVLRALTSADPRSRELRQNNPFAGVLPEDERAQVHKAFTGWATT